MKNLVDAISLPGVIAIGVAFIIIMFLIVVSKFLKKVEPGKAMIIISPFAKNGPKVTFVGALVFPIIHKVEIMDISTKVMTVTRKGTDGLICKDNIRADITVHYYIRVNKNEDDVRQVATSIGCQRASAYETLNELFQAKFSEALKTVGKQMDYEELFQERTIFKEEIIKTIGRDLNGYKLEDTAIDYLAQTPLEQLDPNDIMDSHGIKKITELTSEQAIQTNEINQKKAEVITKRNVEAKERILELEKQQAEAEAKQQAQIDIIQAREEAEKNKVMHEELLKSESARLTTEEKVSVQDANKNREVEIANKNKERAIIVETERIEKERQLEVTQREKEVALATIEKDKAVEEERKNIQEIVKQRVAVERTVAEEEEKTKDTRAIAGAERNKKVEITLAEKEAEKNLIIDIKSAEAKEKAANHLGKEKEILAEAEKISAFKIAEAKETMAKGIIAEESAKGLAEVKVKESDADAVKKMGFAEAEAKKQMGLATAESNFKLGEAEANALKIKYNAEAEGIKEKAESMKIFDAVGREHEEFKLKLDWEEKVMLKEIDVKKDIAMAQAEVLAQALKSANIDIVGGEMQFFDKLSNAVIQGRTNSALIENNNVLTEIKDSLLKPMDENPVMKIKKLIDQLGISSETVKNLSLSGLVSKLSTQAKGDDGLKQNLDVIGKMLKQFGLGDLVLTFQDGINQQTKDK